MKMLIILCGIIFSFSLASAQSAQDIDKRATSKYSSAQLAAMSPTKKAQINFYYTKSFEINSKGKACPSCPVIDPEKFDVSKYESRRHATRRVVVFETEPGFPVSLLSHEELQNAYKEIAEQY